MKHRRPASSVRFMTTITKDFVRANGIDIHYIEAGTTDAPTLVLLHGGLVSTSEIWAPTPISYASHLKRLAEDFHIIAPDARGSAMTTQPGGPVSMSMLADDVAGLIDALGLDRPAVAGFSEGGLTALLLGMRHPDSIRALVCDSGYDTLNPDAPAFAMLPALLGGLPHVDPDVVEQSFGQDPEMAEVFALMKADQDAARGEGYWRTYIERTLERWSHWPGYGYTDLVKITVPTLILVGDRDDLCSVEEAAVACRNLGQGQLAVMPDIGHVISTGKIEALVSFLTS
jgi:pimeloyl-ACP methyl ester carboxylesterase